MANQLEIDRLSEQISTLIDKGRNELIDDLVKLANQIDNEPLFLQAINEMDITEILRSKLQNATNLYVNAHRKVLESTIGFAELEAGTLSSLISLNQSVLDNTVINTVSAHIKNEVAKGILAGIPPEQIARSVASSSISVSRMETLINTSLNTYSRTVTNEMMKVAPKNTKYVYIGPVDEKTRSECKDMANAGLLTETQIKSKFSKYGSILVEGGGFNCRHKWEIASEEGIEFFEGKQNA
tara:strand:- start:19 stop:738 length:720 start_codon:yes stop_codon:yes gene_type:complete